MREDFLHFIWRTRQFAFRNLRTTEGKPVEIIDFGSLNNAGGPDFKEACVSVDGITWAGSVEMHLVASDWNRHRHSSDPAYGNVVLHVVMEEDEPVYYGGRRLPCIEMRGLINPGILHKYRKLDQLEPWVACANLIEDVDNLTKDSWLERMLVERLETRSARILELLGRYTGDWESVCQAIVFRAFGFHRNGLAFERLAGLVPHKVLKGLGDDVFEVEAVLFGCAGMLNRIFIDAYPLRLQQSFTHLAHKYGLKGMGSHEWNWGRSRPANFPSVRISQLAALIVKSPGFMSLISESSDVNFLNEMLDVSASEYWNDHTDFDKDGGKAVKSLGESSVRSVLINAIVPVMFVYGKHTGNDALCDQAVNLIAQLPAERNSLLGNWEKIGMSNTNAGQSQALIHLKGSYCSARRCTECAIGAQILLAES